MSMTICVREHTDGLEGVYTFPGEDRIYRKTELIEGLKKLDGEG